ASTLTARIFAASFNYYFAKKLVFHSKGNATSEIFKFALLVLALMMVSYSFVKILVAQFYMNVYLAKIVAEGTLFFVSFALQNVFVFGQKRLSEKTFAVKQFSS